MSIQFNGFNTIWGADTGFRQVTSLSNAGGNTLTTKQTINGIILRTGGGAQAETTPTATQLIGEIPGAVVGTSFDLLVVNGSGGTHTLTLGTGVSAASGVTVTLTTATGSAHLFRFIVTALNAPAISVVSLGSATS